MSDLPEPKFRKTKSEKWAVMGPVVTLEEALAGDGKVQVLKKSGDHSTFTIGSLGKPFDVDGVQMCYGYASEDDDGGAGSGGSGGGASAGGGGSASGQRSRPPARAAEPAPVGPPPERDSSEPLPEYQGEDHWDDGF